MIANIEAGPVCVLVTGAAGFVGRHVVAALLDRGHEVVALQRRGELPPEVKRRCKRLLSGDICDPDVQQEALKDVQAVCHLAAHIPAPSEDVQEAAACYHSNALATWQLAAQASEQGIQRFVHFSTGNMYGPADRPCTESDSLFPVESAVGYFVSKLAAEVYLADISRRSAMEVVVLRVGTPYGPGEPSQKVIPTFLRLAAEGQPRRLVNGGRAKYNFVYVTDVADCAVVATERGPSGTYNVASGEHTSVLEIAHAAADLYGEREPAVCVEPAVAEFCAGFPAMSVERARQTWGFAPLPLAVGLRRYRASLAKESGRP